MIDCAGGVSDLKHSICVAQMVLVSQLRIYPIEFRSGQILCLAQAPLTFMLELILSWILAFHINPTGFVDRSNH